MQQPFLDLTSMTVTAPPVSLMEYDPSAAAELIRELLWEKNPDEFGYDAGYTYLWGPLKSSCRPLSAEETVAVALHFDEDETVKTAALDTSGGKIVAAWTHDGDPVLTLLVYADGPASPTVVLRNSCAKKQQWYAL